MPTKQQTLDRVRRFITKQGCQARTKGPDPVCLLRGPRDPKTHRPVKCGVGCLLPDSEYTPELEGASLQFNDPLQAIMARLGYDVPLLIDIQRAHDHVTFKNGPGFLRDLEGSLRRVAANHGLSF